MCRCMWRLTKGKKLQVAMKVLKKDYRNNHLNEFMDLAGKWALLQSTSICRLYGITLLSPISMVLEYVPYGPFDDYLNKKKSSLKQADLIEAASNLATALWHIEEHGIIHGHIRCSKLLVAHHDENSICVKLIDPGIHTTYDIKDLHWIPIECYANLGLARFSKCADVWAFATTLFEIFSFGASLPVANCNFYLSGRRLPKLADCPVEVYEIMKDCWHCDPHKRKHPQAILRDVNQILYQVFNSRKVHSYAKVFSKPSKDWDIAGSMNTIHSNETEDTILECHDELLSVSELADLDKNLPMSENLSDVSCYTLNQDYEMTDDYDWSTIISNFNFSTSTTSLDSINSLQSIFELGSDRVVLQGKIGQGFYGEVYKGFVEYDDVKEPRQVAVKKLKTSAMASCIRDFEREISIMKTLKHPNIVEILGVLQDPEVAFVMEYVPQGSLQSYLKIYRERITTEQLLKYAGDVALGMAYLGAKHIVHRDLAARNLLVVDEDHVKISDFGLAQYTGSGDYYILKTNRELPIKWYAPESLSTGKFSTYSDVWSFGVTLWEMFSFGDEPQLALEEITDSSDQLEQQRLLEAFADGIRYPCPAYCPQTVYSCVIRACWELEPAKRPTFQALHQITAALINEFGHSS